MSKKFYIDRIVSCVLLLGWMVFIFALSSENAGTSSNTSGQIIKKIAEVVNRDFVKLPPAEQHSIIENWQALVRTTAHFIEYVVLGFLSANTVRAFNLRQKFIYRLPILFCCIYSIGDEIHQIFVPGRSCQFQDIVVDTVGGVVGTVCFLILMWLIKKVINRKQKI